MRLTDGSRCFLISSITWFLTLWADIPPCFAVEIGEVSRDELLHARYRGDGSAEGFLAVSGKYLGFSSFVRQGDEAVPEGPFLYGYMDLLEESGIYIQAGYARPSSRLELLRNPLSGDIPASSSGVLFNAPTISTEYVESQLTVYGGQGTAHISFGSGGFSSAGLGIYGIWNSGKGESALFVDAGIYRLDWDPPSSIEKSLFSSRFWLPGEYGLFLPAIRFTRKAEASFFGNLHLRERLGLVSSGSFYLPVLRNSVDPYSSLSPSAVLRVKYAPHLSIDIESGLAIQLGGEMDASWLSGEALLPARKPGAVRHKMPGFQVGLSGSLVISGTMDLTLQVSTKSGGRLGGFRRSVDDADAEFGDRLFTPGDWKVGASLSGPANGGNWLVRLGYWKYESSQLQRSELQVKLNSIVHCGVQATMRWNDLQIFWTLLGIDGGYGPLSAYLKFARNEKSLEYFVLPDSPWGSQFVPSAYDVEIRSGVNLNIKVERDSGDISFAAGLSIVDGLTLDMLLYRTRHYEIPISVVPEFFCEIKVRSIS